MIKIPQKTKKKKHHWRKTRMSCGKPSKVNALFVDSNLNLSRKIVENI